MDHKKLLAQLGDEKRVHLTQKSNLKGLLWFASHAIAISITGVWILSGLLGWQVAVLLHGIQLVFLFTLLHETVHSTPFKSPWMNTLAGYLCGFVILLPPIWFRYFHLAHHRYTHDPEKDPELETPLPESVGRYLWVVTGIPVWCSHIKTLFVNATGRFDYSFLPGSANTRVTWEARIMLLGYGGVASVAWLSIGQEVFYLWILPILVGQPFLRLYLMAEHGRCPHVANMLENTRTTNTTRFVRWLAWNMPYHIEHHAYPSVPFHRLPEFHEITRDYIDVEKAGYSGFHKGTVRELINQ